MAKVVEKKDFTTKAGTAARAAEILNKKYGQRTVISGTQQKRQVPRLPTGIFDLTLRTGGGYPIHRMTRILGPEHGGKSSIAIQAVKMADMVCWRCMNILEYCTCKNHEPLRQISCYCDVENTLDREWAEAIGVRPESYFIPNMDSGNEYMDAVDAFLQADDCGLVIIDSVAMLIPSLELERVVGDGKVASQAKLVTSAVQRLTRRLSSELRRGHPCCVIAINQLRANPGVMYGPKETEAGGNAFRYWSSLGFKVGKTTTKEAQFAGENKYKLGQTHRFKIDKEKVWVQAAEGTYTRVRENIFSKKNPDQLIYCKGQIADHKYLFGWLKDLEMIKETPKGIMIDGFTEEMRNESAIIGLMKEDGPLYYQLHSEVTKRVYEKANA